MKVFITVLLTVVASNFSYAESGLYGGASSSKKWDATSICQTARMLAKASLTAPEIDYVYNKKCTVKKLTAPLLGRYSHYTPYAATWNNGVAIRSFETSKGLRIMGVSHDGMPFSWNNDHKPIAKENSVFASECVTLFKEKSEAKNISVVSTEKYSDKSGAKVFIKFTNKNGVAATGTCLFERSKLIMATSKVKADRLSKMVYSNY